jgi:hypothetical protein
VRTSYAARDASLYCGAKNCNFKRLSITIVIIIIIIIIIIITITIIIIIIIITITIVIIITITITIRGEVGLVALHSISARLAMVTPEEHVQLHLALGL